MELSDEQYRAVQDVIDWVNNPESPQIFRLFGYAGTGKTTISQYIAKELYKFNIIFAAYTGKAALVLRQKGCDDARTIHNLIYNVKGKSALRLKELKQELAAEKEKLADLSSQTLIRSVTEYIKKINEQITQEIKNLKAPAFTVNRDSELQFADLLIVDEASTVNKQIGEDLLSFGVKILAVGDPKQLPPVQGEAMFSGVDPDVLLTEIHRQAEGNPIIQIATQLRSGDGQVSFGEYGKSRVLATRNEMKENYLDFSQIIVATNKLRQKINSKMRQHLGFTSLYPEVGDKLVCCRNNHEIGILNGSLWIVDQVLSSNPFRCELEISSYDQASDLIESVVVSVHSAPFVGAEIDYWEIKEAEKFEYGYAITAHKAQGSQWENVLIMYDGPRCWAGEHKEKWLYTAVTRAIDRVVLCK